MNLLLVPTAKERERLQSFARHVWPEIYECGFGVIAAAARCTELIADLNPQHVFLVGIAGSLQMEATVGKAYAFESVSCYGLGVGVGAAHEPASAMGWKQWPYPPEVSDTLGLSVSRVREDRLLPCLVTVTAASANESEAKDKRSCYPTGAAEDMEGFGVALACRLKQVPLTIVRGISNRAGERDHKQWRVPDALQAAATLLEDLWSEH